MQQDASIVKVQDLYFSHSDVNVVFDGINLNIPRKKISAIMGPSGSGKTPDSGKLLVNNVNIPTLKTKALYKMRRMMGIMFQYGALFTDLNVYENLAFPLREHTNLPEDMIRDLVMMKLQAVGLRGTATMSVNELSGGMARRVALARAIMLDPELMMYDEPFTGQDPIGQSVLINLIRQLNDAFGLTSIVVTHNIEEVKALADYMFIILDGKLMAEGPPEEILKDTNPKVHQFVHGLPDGPIPFQHSAPDYRKDLEL